MTCPCYKCKDRSPDCHAKREAYKEYSKEREKIRQAKHSEAMTRIYCIESHKRYRHG